MKNKKGLVEIASLWYPDDATYWGDLYLIRKRLYKLLNENRGKKFKIYVEVLDEK